MSAAHALSKHPLEFDVTLYERSSFAGGMATSTPINKEKYGASYINDGVQGSSPTFHNTLAILEELGFKASQVEMKVSFGKDNETDFYTNVFPSRVVDKWVVILGWCRRLTVRVDLQRTSKSLDGLSKL